MELRVLRYFLAVAQEGGVTVNGGYGSTAIQAQNVFIVGKHPIMNSVDVEINSNAGGVYYNVQ